MLPQRLISSLRPSMAIPLLLLPSGRARNMDSNGLYRAQPRPGRIGATCRGICLVQGPRAHHRPRPRRLSGFLRMARGLHCGTLARYSAAWDRRRGAPGTAAAGDLDRQALRFRPIHRPVGVDLESPAAVPEVTVTSFTSTRITPSCRGSPGTENVLSTVMLTVAASPSNFNGPLESTYRPGSANVCEATREPFTSK